MNIVNILQVLQTYYGQRQVEHSQLAKDGFNHYAWPKFIVVNNMKEAREFHCQDSDVITLNGLDKLRGHKRPLIFDNPAMVTIISESLETILKQEKIIEELKDQLHNLRYEDYGELIGQYNTLQKDYGELFNSHKHILHLYDNIVKEMYELKKSNIKIILSKFFKHFRIWTVT